MRERPRGRGVGEGEAQGEGGCACVYACVCAGVGVGVGEVRSEDGVLVRRPRGRGGVGHTWIMKQGWWRLERGSE